MSARLAPIADANVMGRSYVLAKSTILAGVAVAQLIDGVGSTLLPRFGGALLDAAWSASLLVATALVWVARFLNSALSDPIESAGIMLISVALVVYLIALHDAFGFAGSGLIVGLIVSTLWNLGARMVMLYRRSKALDRAVQ